MKNSVSWKSALLGALAAVVLLLLVALIVVVTGAYNVAATDRHAPLVGWALDTTMQNSVESRAADLPAPVAFTPEMIAAGAGEYKAMCEHCHGGVGAGRAGWAKLMRPHPPALAEAASEWEPAEVFWIVNHGIKMSGMPAFGATHDEQTIWNIAGFVKMLPEMSAAEYAAYGSGSGNASHGHEGGSSSHDH
ncbi:c-type cytochrome [Altericroceibacterium xinjiangense]|uniref:c-type cytochrome n=1 Tax=Altericroceibacterium xinjiangense TaxID=762261 RepID=UPI0019D25C06|nr:cytochrome c [Altericroceibacterium xinjiangense]